MSKVSSITGRPMELPPPPALTPTEKLIARSKAVTELSVARLYLNDARRELKAASDDAEAPVTALLDDLDITLAEMAGRS